MNKIMTALFAGICLMATQAYAVDTSCEAKATEKKLDGAAKTSFMMNWDNIAVL